MESRLTIDSFVSFAPQAIEKQLSEMKDDDRKKEIEVEIEELRKNGYNDDIIADALAGRQQHGSGLTFSKNHHYNCA